MWHYQRYRRKFFEDYAKENGLEPCNPDNWYLQAKEKIMARKVSFSLTLINTLFDVDHHFTINLQGARKVIAYHGNSISKALLDLFPNIGLDKSFQMKSMAAIFLPFLILTFSFLGI
jgi:hypothetical protein